MPLHSHFLSQWRGRAGPFLIFALGRTGSTTLRRLLECHPALTCIHEPFNPDRRSADTPTDGERLRTELRQLRKRAPGIKHVWDPEGWPFPSGSPLNRELVTLPGQRILFLNRRNALRRLVSVQMSNQARAWGSTAEDRAATQTFPFAPLDTETLGRCLARERDVVADYRHAIVASRNPFIELWYEDAFDPRVAIEAKEALIGRIFHFLGVKPTLATERRERLRALLLPDDGPLNSATTYRRVPGIDDVEARFGCDATGRLFYAPSGASTEGPR